ncbi:MAG: hypothetical protein RIC19_16335 [Phaeodactylibacter sp.]|uniref:hypothetical protein n=1 Tax=Phaeodactylibacter sp. TaxID=1940289 RepID=UPI0032EF7A7E
MSKLRHFFERMGWRTPNTTKPAEAEQEDAPKPFGQELKAELRKRLVGYSATFIFWAIGLIIFFMGGYIVYDRIQDAKDRKRNFHEVCIDGFVLDTYEGTGVEGATVFIEGDPKWKHISNTSGYFRICITIPKAQTTVNLTIEKEDYVRQYFNQVAVPDNEHTRGNIQHFNLTSVKNVPSTPIPN